MTLEADEATRLPLVSDHALHERVSELLQGAIRRQWWTLYLDEHDVQLPLIMPVAGYPERPDEPSGEEGTAAQVLASRLSEIVEYVGAAKVVFVWERPGDAVSTTADRAWARALGEACRAESVAVRAQFIVHDDGARWFALDDYA
ncbi:hypothetical protein [Agromyces sp. Marseille-P2726]|uniref:hypothetical protein n=1 Tax=Agromyces sp. Marseille-P2726 TaxID=2709132 RepID=UPI00156F5DB8|nr:hypothetical protein [Agromyces sp. Marseille-P2726]